MHAADAVTPSAIQPHYRGQMAAAERLTRPDAPKQADPEDKQLRKAFDDFVGQVFYGQMLAAMRKTVDKPAYFHGGRGEEVFQGQLDQMLAERLAEASAETFTAPMFDLFTLKRS